MSTRCLRGHRSGSAWRRKARTRALSRRSWGRWSSRPSFCRCGCGKSCSSSARARAPAPGVSTLSYIPVVTSSQRRQTAVVDVGGVRVGGTHPIVVQSMTNTDTADPAATATPVPALHAAGSELVRVTVNNEAAAAAVPEIVAQVDVPGLGDFHYNGHLLLTKFPQSTAPLPNHRTNPPHVAPH